MKNEINWEELSFKIITEAGSAKSSAMEGLYAAKEGKFEEASEKIRVANQEIAKASHFHMDVITKEAQGVKLDFKVLFMHAEDQLLTTQTLILLVSEMIEMYKEMRGEK